MEDPLLEVAIDQFGLLGMEAASTRAIAARAGVAMSTITYRHGGKEGLYLAAAKYIAENIDERMRASLDAAHADPADHLVAIIRQFGSLMLRDEVEAWSRFIIREQMQPSAAFALMWRVMRQTLDMIARRYAEATGEADARQARIAALTMIGQALVFRAARATVLHALDRTEIDDADLVRILDQLEANVRAIIKQREQR